MSFEEELDQMNADIKSTFATTVTFTDRTDGAFSSATMRRTRSQVVTSGLGAVRGPGVNVYDQGFKEEEVKYSILAADLATRPDAGDVVTDGGIDRTVVAVELSVDRKWYAVTTRRKL